MRRKREKGYWERRKERFSSGREARSRAGRLRDHAHVEHVKTAREADDYIVTYSVAAWYLAELEKAGIRL